MTTYWRGSEFVWQDEEDPAPLTIGAGVILGTPNYPGASRWRVVDIWLSYDRRGHFDAGRHVFLDLVSNTEDDYPKRLAPGYFVDDEEDERPGGPMTVRDW